MMQQETFDIEAKNICKKFGEREALKDVSISVPAGARLFIFGPNGAGKTTLLRILTTLSRPSAGTLNILGMDSSNKPEEIRARIGFVSHKSMLYDDLTAEENLIFYANLYGIKGKAARERARNKLRAVGLSGRRLDCPRTFSRGMTQRLSIARAFVHDPQIVFLDEPYSGLDPHAVNLLDNFLHEMCANKTLVCVSHNVQHAYNECTHMLLISAGEVRLFDSRENVDFETFSALYNEVVGAGVS